jgi:hypothetical protein
MHLLVFYLYYCIQRFLFLSFVSVGVGLENSCIAETYMGRFGKMP